MPADLARVDRLLLGVHPAAPVRVTYRVARPKAVRP